MTINDVAKLLTILLALQPGLPEAAAGGSGFADRKGLWRTGNLAGVVDSVLMEFDRADGPGAAVLVVRDGRPVVKKGYGLADVENRVRITPATNFRLASITKQFTAASILLLRRKALVDTADTLARFFPEFPAYGRRITISQLIHHTSGLPAYEDLLHPSRTKPLMDADVLEIISREDSTYFPPGTSYRYSNTAYALLALIVERVSGRTFPEFLQQNVFTPVRMKGTVAFVEGGPPVSNRAYGYSPGQEPGTFRRTDQSMTSSVLGDGGIYSSLDDLALWDRALREATFLDATELAEAFTPHVPAPDTTSGYGFGWMIGSYRRLRTVYHGGSTIGFTHAFIRFPDEGFTVALLTNLNDGSPFTYAYRIVDLFLQGPE